jgi:hypothetical protein
MLGNIIIESLQKHIFLIDLDNEMKYVVLKDPYILYSKLECKITSKFGLFMTSHVWSCCPKSFLYVCEPKMMK